MNKPLRSEKLYIMQGWQWQHSLAFIDPQHLTATVKLPDDFVVVRPFWCSPEDKRRWLATTGRLEVDEAELSPETREAVHRHELMQ